jgi:putative intracellular protease/amidase
MKILMVLTSHDVLGNTGRKTGFWLEEFAAPFHVLDAGHFALDTAADEIAALVRGFVGSSRLGLLARQVG